MELLMTRRTPPAPGILSFLSVLALLLGSPRAQDPEAETGGGVPPQAGQAPVSSPALSSLPAGPRAADSAALELPQARARARRRDTVAMPIRADFIRKMPGAMNDPVRAASFAPGVAVQSDLNVRPLVRGGDADQTRVMFGGIPLLQPYHVGGVFSLFNLGTLESVDLHRDALPVEDPGSLSGVLRLKARRPALDGLHGRASVSMVRGDLHAEVPVVRGRFGVFGGGQSFLFNESLHGLLDLTHRVSDDSVFRNDIRGYQDHINLPGFRDLHWGAAFASAPGFEAAYMGGHSRDAYAVVVPRAVNIVRANPAKPPEDNPIPIVPVLPKKEIARSKKLSIDSISSVDIGNGSHLLGLRWDAGRHFLEADAGWQGRGETVHFKDAAATADPLALAYAASALDIRLMDTWTGPGGHRIKAGAAFGHRRQSFDVEVPYVLYDMIVNGNMDMLEPLGLFAPEGFSIAKEDSSRSNFDYLGEYPARIRFSHKGKLEERTGALFLSHALAIPSGTLTYGLRAEYHSLSRELFPSPRLDLAWTLGSRDHLLVTTGLYAQSSHPFYERDRNPSLRSEKSAQLALQWTHRFSTGYKTVAGAYGKRYHDLVVPRLVPNRTLDLDGLLLPHPGSGLTSQQASELRAVLDTVADEAALPDSLRDAAYRAFGGLEFAYHNGGTGTSIGTELAFHYAPFAAWSGWLSAELSLSTRRDSPGEAAYPFRYHRPVVVNWVNWFDMPGSYEIGLTYRWALGQPYTPYSGTLDGTGSLEPVLVGARNSGRLAPFSRLDLRLSRGVRILGAECKAFVEVWNSMNDPNYFGRDDRSGELKTAQLNWPFPLFFLGISGEI
jgi:hypothetical protein